MKYFKKIITLSFLSLTSGALYMHFNDRFENVYKKLVEYEKK